MRKSRFSETQIVGILRDAESGVPVPDLLRTHGVSKATFFKWRSKYGGASVSDVRQLRELEAEHAKLKRMYADLGAGARGHQGCPAPKIVGPSAKRQLAEVLVQEHRLPVQRACRVVRLSRTAYYQPPVPASRRDAAVIAALTDAVARYPRWGFWKLHDRLRAEGRPWNHKRLHRVYCALRLNLPRRTTRRVPRRVRQPLTAPPVLNRTWALDFMTETLYDRRRIRLLTESYRVSRRPHFLGGGGLWDVHVGFLRRCVSARFGWSRSIAPPTRRSGGVLQSVAPKRGYTAETLRKWVRQAQRDAGYRPGLTTSERERLKELEREVRELKRANEILRKASAYFAQAELDRRGK